MVGAYQNLNGSCDLTTPLSGMVCHPLATINLPTEIKVYRHSLRTYERRYKMSKLGGLRVVGATQAPSKCAPATMSKQHRQILQVERFFRQSRMLLRHFCRFFGTMLPVLATMSSEISSFRQSRNIYCLKCLTIYCINSIICFYQNLRSRFGIERYAYTESHIGQIPCVCMYVCM